LEWSPLAFLQPPNTPIPVTITARNYFGQTVSNFSGPLIFSAWSSLPGAGASMLGAVQPDRGFTGGNYTVGFAFTPAQNLRVLQVRHFSGNKVSIWSDSGELIASQEISGPPGQWSTTPLATNLQLTAGVTYRLGFYGGTGPYYALDTLPFAFPWGQLGNSFFALGDAFPNFERLESSRFLVDLVYLMETPSVQLAPGQSPEFVDGTWSGTITFTGPATNLVLFAEDLAGHTAVSSRMSAGTTQDADADGLPDLWETSNFGSIDLPGGGPNEDPDADGMTNLAEYLAGTDPLDPASALRLTAQVEGNVLYLGFPTTVGKRYQLETTQKLLNSTWEIVGEEFTGDGRPMQVQFAREEALRFYRIRLAP
jgi:hypothetical protein